MGFFGEHYNIGKELAGLQSKIKKGKKLTEEEESNFFQLSGGETVEQYKVKMGKSELKIDDNCFLPSYSKDRKKVLEIAKANLPSNEELIIGLKGTFKEYLLCTDKQVYILKKGFMTGHMVGSGNFKMPYGNITNVEVNYTFGGGYFEVSAGGMQNTRKSYWSQDPEDSASKAPNAISVASKQEKEIFERAGEIILQKVNKSRNTNDNYVYQFAQESISEAEELRKYKDLVDEGIITEEEFTAKKKQLLNI
ncbi:MAG: SHOCT domain-containing protein [Tetragenococcus koreensis]|mgnify:CR=1 FL=1|nr:SHOCT domain-containing protein [Tetragenococcus koreensis]